VSANLLHHLAEAIFDIVVSAKISFRKSLNAHLTGAYSGFYEPTHIAAANPRREAMKLFFYALSVLVLLGVPAHAIDRDCPECRLYHKAKPRGPIPTNKEIVCVNFTLPNAPAKVTIRVKRGDTVVYEDSKVVSSREGQFCPTKVKWLSAGGQPDWVYLCSEHSVTIHNADIAPILSGRGHRPPEAYACLRGIAGCGRREAVSIPRDLVNR